MNILAADDSLTVLEMVSQTLSLSGHNVHTVESGGAALKAIERVRFDLVISDLNMASGSGFDFLEGFRRDKAHAGVPFVILTTETGAELKAAARQAGATAWLQKPFVPEALIDLVQRLGAP
jgi:two-component system, chemotaxis family, chemotaxis protein CheY